jgi:hypothetical protein
MNSCIASLLILEKATISGHRSSDVNYGNYAKSPAGGGNNVWELMSPMQAQYDEDPARPTGNAALP